jgi:hypothetical protein
MMRRKQLTAKIREREVIARLDLTGADLAREKLARAIFEEVCFR